MLIEQWPRCEICACVQDGVGITAINDSLFLEAAVFQILKKHIRDQPYYMHVMELFHDVGHSLLSLCLSLSLS